MEGIRKRLIDLCIEIYACNELDYEVTLAGNGTNASEASNVADEILNILNIKKNDIQEDIGKEVDRINEDIKNEEEE
jgi:hypothetical protein